METFFELLQKNNKNAKEVYGITDADILLKFDNFTSLSKWNPFYWRNRILHALFIRQLKNAIRKELPKTDHHLLNGFWSEQDNLVDILKYLSYEELNTLRQLFGHLAADPILVAFAIRNSPEYWND